ncbi:MAG TPA: amidohydrolase family protein [Acidimicrobiales bacterium]|nr:amidohydrolase family protein [Acidimicrobiales bacterium]
MEIPRIISVDDHVVEPPDLWQDRLPARFKERGPRVERIFGRIGPDGHGGFCMVEDRDAPGARWADEWHYDDMRLVVPAGMVQVHDLRTTHYTVPVTYDEMAPGTHQQAARLADMDLNHIEAALCFPTVPRFCGQSFLERDDKELALLCVQIYNDWMIEEWCGGDGHGRLLPLTLIPLWDADLAAAEVRRCAARGSTAAAFSENPSWLNLPSIHSGHWDPFIAACDETGTVINMHIGSASRFGHTSPDAPPFVGKSISFLNSLGCLGDWLASGLLERFKQVKIALSEGQVGWIPFVAGRFDNEWELKDLWEPDLHERVPNLPSSYIPGRVYGCIFDDLVGLKVRDLVGMSQIMFETDYPHGDTSFPYSRQMAEKLVTGAGLTEQETWQLVRGNAIECYRLEQFGIAS